MLYIALMRLIRWKSSTLDSLPLVSFCLPSELTGGVGVCLVSLLVSESDLSKFLLFCYESLSKNLVENFSLVFSNKCDSGLTFTFSGTWKLI